MVLKWVPFLIITRLWDLIPLSTQLVGKFLSDAPVLDLVTPQSSLSVEMKGYHLQSSIQTLLLHDWLALLLAIEETSLTQFAVLQWHYTSSELCVVHTWLYSYKHCVKRVARLRNMVIENPNCLHIYWQLWMPLLQLSAKAIKQVGCSTYSRNVAC